MATWTTAGLQRPHILPLFDSGEARGLLFYVIPFVDGESLHERIERERQLPIDDTIRIAGSAGRLLRTPMISLGGEQVAFQRDGNVLVDDPLAVLRDGRQIALSFLREARTDIWMERFQLTGVGSSIDKGRIDRTWMTPRVRAMSWRTTCRPAVNRSP